MAINAGQILNGKFRVPFSQTPATSRAVASWAADGLPPGLTINTQTGLISGAPTVTSEGSPSSLWPSYITTQDEHFVTKLSASSSYCIGLNTTGEIVEGTTSSSPIDSQANANIRDSITGATGLSAGPWHLLAITSGGVVGILKSTAASGAGTPGNRGQITPPAGLTGVTKVSAGWNHSLALKSNGTVVAFGADDYGQSSIPAGLSNVVDIATGQYFSVAVKADGTVVHWGASTLGTFDWITDPATLTGVALVRVGLNPFNVASAFAVKSNGTVVILLGNDLTPPSDLSAVSTVAAASNYVAGLKSNGTVVIWGDITTSTQNSVAALSGVAAIAAQSDALFAAKSDGTVAAIKISNVTGIFQLPKTESELLRFSLTEGPPIIAPSQTFSGTVGAAFNGTILFEDVENAPATSVTVTGLPSGLTNTNGVITGTPTASGTFTINISASGAGGTSSATSATISIASGAPVITPGQSFTGKVGVAFSQAPLFSSGPVTAWQVFSGVLPAGLSLNATTGAISGTPTTLGNSSPFLRASNSGGASAATQVSFAISAGAPLITPSQSFSGTVGAAFSQTPALTNSANRPAISWSAEGLPAGLSINATTGAITGTPTTAGAYTASFTATGSGGTSAATNIAFTISASGGGDDGGGGGNTMPILLAENQTLIATLGAPFSQTPALLLGTAAAWYATGLPEWASINAATGAITGTPTFSGNSVVTVTAKSAENATSTALLFLNTTAWNTLEIFVDPKNRRILSKADTKSPLSKITLKRDDRLPIRVVFVDGTTPFSIPDSFSVSVGLKQSYADTEYLAHSSSATGTIDLSSEEIQELFLGNAATIPALLEVRWENPSSSFRTATLPLDLQNSVIRGNAYSPAAYLGADDATTAAATSASVRALSTPVFGIAKGNSYNITILPTARRVSIAYPASLGDLASVRYAEFNNSDITDTFTKTTVQVTAPNSTALAYFVYTYIAAVPFDDYATYTVTL